VIEPEVATRWRSQDAFDRSATLLIGMVAVLAAVLAILQAGNGLASTRAQAQAARFAADAAAKISASSLVQDAALRSQQDALVMGMEAISTMMVALQSGDAGLSAVGTAGQAASGRLAAALTESAATSGAAPVDPYAASLISATVAQLNAEVAEQNRQADLSNEAGARAQRAVLGLSLLTLAGVLVGISAVLGRGRAGWATLFVASGTIVVTIGVTLLTVL
jgi:hypothetical protein